MKFAYNVAVDGDLRIAAAGAARRGFDALTIPAALLEPRAISTTGRREVRHVLSQHNLTAAGLRHDLAGKGLTKSADADRVIDEMRPVLELARDCAFAMVACDLGTLPRSPGVAMKRTEIDPLKAGLILLPDAVDVAEVTSSPLTEAELRHAAFVNDVLREIGAMVDRVGMPVAFAASLASTADLAHGLSMADCPLFFREIDPAAAVEDVIADVDAVVKRLPTVLHVLARDAHSAGGKTRSAIVGEGDVPWADLLESLADADFAGFITCQGSPEAATQAMRLLRGE